MSKIIGPPQSGRVGSVVYVNSARYGPLVRQYVPPTNGRTASQQTNRSEFGSVSRRWRGLLPQEGGHSCARHCYATGRERHNTNHRFRHGRLVCRHEERGHREHRAGAGRLDDRLIGTMAAVARHCRERQRFCQHTETVPQVAVIFSTRSLYRTSNRLFGGWGGHIAPARGFVDALVDNGYSVDVLPEWNLSETIGRYPLVVVPDWPDAGTTVRDTVLERVRAGGNALVAGAANISLFAGPLGLTIHEQALEESSYVAGQEVWANVEGLWQATVLSRNLWIAVFVRSFGVADGSVESLRADVRANMQRELEQRLEAALKERVMNLLMERNPLEIPAALVAEESQRLREQAKGDLTRAGHSSALDLPLSLFEEQARKRVWLGLLVGEVIRSQGLKVDAERVRNRIERLAESYEQPEDVVSWYYGNREALRPVENLVLEDQVADWVVSRLQVEDEPTTFAAMKTH